MKTINEIRKLIAVFLTYSFLMPTFYSCASDANIYNSNLNSDYKKEAQQIVNSVDIFIKKYKNINNTMSKSIGGVELTQELVDEYAVLLGYDVGDINIATVEDIVDKYGLATQNGVEQMLNQYNLSDYTKLSFKEMSEGEWFKDLINQLEFDVLPDDEKELLLLFDSVKNEALARDRTPEEAFWQGFGAVAGAIVGGVICGICALVGGIIGGLFAGTCCK